MKKIFLIFTILFSAESFAFKYFPVGKEGAKTKYRTKAACEQKEEQDCFDVSGKNLAYYELKTVQVDDISNPILKTKYKSVACSSHDDCVEKITALNLPSTNTGTLQQVTDFSSYCDEGITDFIDKSKNPLMPGWSFYCTGITGYPKIDQKSLVENATKKSEYEAKAQAQEIKDAKLALVAKARGFGESLKNEVYLLNQSKNLSSAQVVTFVEAFAPIDRLLTVGAIATAKSSIEAIEPSALMSAEDKALILEKINAFLNN